MRQLKATCANSNDRERAPPPRLTSPAQQLPERDTHCCARTPRNTMKKLPVTPLVVLPKKKVPWTTEPRHSSQLWRKATAKRGGCFFSKSNANSSRHMPESRSRNTRLEFHRLCKDGRLLLNEEEEELEMRPGLLQNILDASCRAQSHNVRRPQWPSSKTTETQAKDLRVKNTRSANPKFSNHNEPPCNLLTLSSALPLDF